MTTFRMILLNIQNRLNYEIKLNKGRESKEEICSDEMRMKIEEK